MPPGNIQSSFTASDILLSCIYGSIVLLVCYLIKLKNAHLPHYKYFLPGVTIKLFGAGLFCTVYLCSYKGGDALNYFSESKIIAKLLFQDPMSFARIVFFGDISYEDFSRHTNDYHRYLVLYDKFTFSFIRLIVPFTVISFGNFMTATILLSAVSFSGIWKLYVIFCEQFPALMKEMALAMFFIPSVVFWGSGFLKDTITISAMGWFIYALYRILNSQKNIKWLACLLINSIILILIKPYILYGLVSASAIWLASAYLNRISKAMERYFFAPIIIILFSLVSLQVVYGIGKDQGRFSLRQTEMDFLGRQSRSDAKSSFYKEPIRNTFISLTKGIISNINATLFRPYPWEVRNLMMAGAALENVFFLTFILWLLFKFKIILLFRSLLKTPFLTFCLFFILIMALIVGISTDNFGTLDRFRIPVLPFFLALCFILKNYLSVAEKKLPEGIQHA